MEKPLKISVCGNEGPLTIVNDSVMHSLEYLNRFDVGNSHDIHRSDIIYWIGGTGPSLKKYLLFWIKKKPIIIIHWIGTDVLGEMKRCRQRGIRRIENVIMDTIFRLKMKQGGLIHLAVAPWLVDELSALHIPATCLPVTTLDIRKLGTVDTQGEKTLIF